MTDVDLVLHDGHVWTGVPGDDGRVQVTDAVAVAGGRVVATGAAAREFSRAAAARVDLEGGSLLPGFGDGHAHPVFGGVETLFAPVRGARSVDELVGRVRAWAAANPDAEWVRGEGYDPSLAPLGEFDARWLDAAVPDRPVVLRGMDYHTAWVNTEALRRGGITAATPDPVDGSISRRPDGSPSGTLREWGAWRRVYDLLPPLDAGQRLAAVRAASAAYSSTGVVFAQDAWVEQDTLDTWLAAAGVEGALTFRVAMALLAEPGGRWRDALDLLVEQRRAVAALGDDRLRAGTVKFFADGILEGGTAALLEPYCNCPHPHHGLPNWEPAELAEAVTAVVGAGFQPHVHAIGDAAVRSALDAVAAAAAAHGDARRPTLAHCQLVAPDDLARFAELGVVANFEPLWAQLDATQTDLTIPRIGDDRAQRQYPMATLLRGGATLSFGSDWPVTSQVPVEGIRVAVTRRTAAGDPPQGWTPHERLTLDEALTAYTAGVAHQAHEEHLWGRIAPGLRADLVWFGDDLHALDPMALGAAQVRGTWLRGERVHG